MQWLMLQQERPQDYVIATGEQHSVREFIERAAAMLEMSLTWTGAGLEERAVDAAGKTVIALDQRYFRPTEVESLLGDASKAKRELGWAPRTGFEALIREMVESDREAARREALLSEHGFRAYNF